MPRPQRVQLAGTLQHVVSRGNDRQRLFKDDADFRRYLSLLNETRKVHGLEVFNYCLMDNHVHLLVSPTVDGALAKVMEHVTKEYAKYFNKKYDRRGHVFEGRYKSYLVQAERYFYACTRYIDLNPVKAGMVEQAQDYKYSGYKGLAYGESTILPLDEHDIYKELASTSKDKQLAYRTLIANYHGEEIDPLNMHGAIIGDQEFKREVRKSRK